MVLPLLLAVPFSAAVAPLGAVLLGAGVLLLAVALVVLGERQAALHRALEALRPAPPVAATPASDERPRFGALFEEPEPSLVARLAAAIRAQPVRVASLTGALLAVGGLVLLGEPPTGAGSGSAELARLRASHDSLRTTLAVLASGARAGADGAIAAAPAPATEPEAVAPRSTAAAPTGGAPAPAGERTAAASRRAEPAPRVAARPVRRSPTPSAAILPPPPGLGAGAGLPPAPVVQVLPPAGPTSTP